jgi:hypothetical protein
VEYLPVSSFTIFQIVFTLLSDSKICLLLCTCSASLLTIVKILQLLLIVNLHCLVVTSLGI